MWSFHSQWWFGLPCHLLVLVHCVFWSPVNADIYQDILEHFMLPSADKLYGEADFIFSAGLGTCTHCQRYQKLVQWPCVTVLDWPVNSPDLNPRESIQEEDETPDPTMQMSWRPLSMQPGLHYTWAVPQADCLHVTPHWCSNSCKRRPFCHTCHTFQKPAISV